MEYSNTAGGGSREGLWVNAGEVQSALNRMRKSYETLEDSIRINIMEFVNSVNEHWASPDAVSFLDNLSGNVNKLEDCIVGTTTNVLDSIASAANKILNQGGEKNLVTSGANLVTTEKNVFSFKGIESIEGRQGIDRDEVTAAVDKLNAALEKNGDIGSSLTNFKNAINSDQGSGFYGSGIDVAVGDSIAAMEQYHMSLITMLGDEVRTAIQNTATRYGDAAGKIAEAFNSQNGDEASDSSANDSSSRKASSSVESSGGGSSGGGASGGGSSGGGSSGGGSSGGGSSGGGSSGGGGGGGSSSAKDESNNNRESITYDENGNKITTKYDENGNPIDVYVTDKNGNNVEHTTSNYDENNRLLEKEKYSYDSNGKEQLEERTEYEYDDNGNVTKERTFDNNNRHNTVNWVEKGFTDSYTYNEDNYVVERRDNESGELLSRYTYNEDGSVEYTKYDGNGSPIVSSASESDKSILEQGGNGSIDTMIPKINRSKEIIDRGVLHPKLDSNGSISIPKDPTIKEF